MIASQIETCKFNAVGPHYWSAYILNAIAGGHTQSRVDDLLHWNYASETLLAD